VGCDERQAQVSLLIDADLEESEQVNLFKHLEVCHGCRGFLDVMIRFRKTAKRDQEALGRDADEILPARPPCTEPRHTRAERGTLGWARIFSGGLRIPTPLAVGMAATLIVMGAILGARIAAVSGDASLQQTAERMSRPAVVVICGMPEVEVLGNSPRHR